MSTSPVTDFATGLAGLGITQAGFRAAVARLTGHRLDPTTTSRWVRGQYAAGPEALAVLALLAEISATRRVALTARL